MYRIPGNLRDQADPFITTVSGRANPTTGFMDTRATAPAGAHATATPWFSLQGPADRIRCGAPLRRLPCGGADTLAKRVHRFFQIRPDGPQQLVGALPFHRSHNDCLFQPAGVRHDTAVTVDTAAAPAPTACRWTLARSIPPARYADMVRSAIDRLGPAAPAAAALRKVVLARYVDLLADRPLTATQVIAQLTDRHATTFSVRLPGEGTAGTGARWLVGASPELLVARQGNSVHSFPLAGTRRRHADAGADQAAGQALLASDKDRREHRAVSESVLDTLAPYCSRLHASATPELVATERLWHLGTPIHGVLRDPDTPVTVLVAALHPTPAVCGLPRDPAYDCIRTLEDFDRDFYAGAVGWTDARGNGRWYVTIRCADICAERVRLYAGAGIVTGSDPATEARETTAKLGVMLNALGVDPALLEQPMETIP